MNEERGWGDRESPFEEYRNRTIRTAKDLKYPLEVVEAIRKADTESEINKIMVNARKRQIMISDREQFAKLERMMFMNRYRKKGITK